MKAQIKGLDANFYILNKGVRILDVVLRNVVFKIMEMHTHIKIRVC